MKPEILTERPERLLIFRLLIGVDQRTLAKLLDKSQGTIWAIESGIRNTIDIAAAIKIINILKKTKQIPSKEILLKRFSEIAHRGRFHGEYAKRMGHKASTKRAIKSAILRKPTEQENAFIKILTEHKIQFQFHGVISASRKFVVDFVFPSERNPKVVLEMKDLKSNYRKRLMAVELAYRAIKIRDKYPQIKLIAVIDGSLQKDAFKIIKSEYDKVLLNSPFKNILKVINSFMGSSV